MKDLRKPAKLAWQGTEDALQIKCAEFLKKSLQQHGFPQELFHHCPSEGMRKPQYRAKLKAMGFRAGVADIILDLRNRSFSGMRCELKRAGGSPSADQRSYLKALTTQGFLCVVVNDLDTFKEVVGVYMKDFE